VRSSDCPRRRRAGQKNVTETKRFQSVNGTAPAGVYLLIKHKGTDVGAKRTNVDQVKKGNTEP